MRLTQCGNFGCLEKHASATAIEAMADMLSLGVHLTSKEVFELAQAGNAKAASTHRPATFASFHRIPRIYHRGATR